MIKTGINNERCAKNNSAGLYPLSSLERKCRGVQLRARLRVLPAQGPHLLGVRDARTEPLRLPQAEQIHPSPAQQHQTHRAAGKHLVKMLRIDDKYQEGEKYYHG